METNKPFILDNGPVVNSATKAVNTIENVFIGIFLLGMFFKLMSWGGGSLIVIFSLSFWSMILFLKALLSPVLYKFPSPTGTAYPALVLMRVGAGVLLEGALFKFQMWKGSGGMLLLGVAIASVGLILGWVALKKLPDFKIVKPEGIRMLVIVITGVLLFSTSDYTLYSYTGIARKDKHYMELFKRCHEDPTQCDSMHIYYEYMRKQRMEKLNETDDEKAESEKEYQKQQQDYRNSVDSLKPAQ